MNSMKTTFLKVLCLTGMFLRCSPAETFFLAAARNSRTGCWSRSFLLDRNVAAGAVYKESNGKTWRHFF